MPRAFPAAFALLAWAFCLLAGVYFINALWVGAMSQDMSESDAWTWLFLMGITWLLRAVDTVFLLAGGGLLVVLAMTRRMDAAHERAVLVSVGLVCAAVLVQVGTAVVWALWGIDWWPHMAVGMLLLLLVPAVLLWPHQPARSLGVLGAGLSAVYVLLAAWGWDTSLVAMAFKGAGVPVPVHAAALRMLPGLIGALGFTCWARAFAGVARRHWPSEDAERARRRRWPLN